MFRGKLHRVRHRSNQRTPGWFAPIYALRWQRKAAEMPSNRGSEAIRHFPEPWTFDLLSVGKCESTLLPLGGGNKIIAHASRCDTGVRRCFPCPLTARPVRVPTDVANEVLNAIGNVRAQ